MSDIGMYMCFEYPLLHPFKNPPNSDSERNLFSKSSLVHLFGIKDIDMLPEVLVT